jgi:hypothetical protein
MPDYRIHALTVCVDYADYLESSLEGWLSGLDSLRVVTSSRDTRTQKLCRDAGIQLHITDVFYERGASFNKWAALSEAVDAMAWQDWILLIDADVRLPGGWRDLVNAVVLQPGLLYGAKRFLENGDLVYDADRMPGYFNLFHNSDANAQRRPLFETHWTHAGRGDCEFHSRWPVDRRVWLPFGVTHLGEPNTNWWGRGNTAAMDAMIQARLREGDAYGTALIEVVEGGPVSSDGTC